MISKVLSAIVGIEGAVDVSAIAPWWDEMEKNIQFENLTKQTSDWQEMFPIETQHQLQVCPVMIDSTPVRRCCKRSSHVQTSSTYLDSGYHNLGLVTAFLDVAKFSISSSSLKQLPSKKENDD